MIKLIEHELMDKQRIRKIMRNKRASLSYEQLNTAANNLARNAQRFPALLAAKEIASYLSCNGEISTHALHKALTNANFFLPRINSFHRSSMQFHSANTKLIKNKFGIDEPIAMNPPKEIHSLDIILMPLVAFDRRKGNRLGMGGGFYDRALAFRKQRQFIKRPLLVGLAHHFQEIEAITAESWDIPLDAVLTDQELIKISR